MFTLRPYQTAAIDSLRDALRSGLKRVLLYSPTGSGKTEIAIDMIRKAIGKGVKTSFVCNRIELVGQASRRFERSEIRHGIVQGINTLVAHDDDARICSIQTIARRGSPESGLIIIDEAHGTPGSKAYTKFLSDHADIPTIGLTATPFTKGLGKHWQKLVVSTTISQLIKDGFLVDVNIFVPSEPDLSKVRIVGGDYHEGDLGAAVDKPVLIGDIVSHWTKLAGAKPTVVFATNIAHSQHIVEQFRASGIPAEHIDCYTKDDERKRILGRVVEGETKIISNVGILQEGWDFPACEVLVLARPTKSLTRYIQMAGRILRPFEGKVQALILDHSGTCRELGYPTEDFELTLDDGERTAAAERREQAEAKAHLCKNCHYLKPPKVMRCPRCGTIPERKSDVATADGELTLLKKGKIASADKQQVYAELLGYQGMKGYKPGWAWHQCKKLFGSACRIEPIPAKPSESTLKLIKYLQIKYAKGRHYHR